MYQDRVATLAYPNSTGENTRSLTHSFVLALVTMEPNKAREEKKNELPANNQGPKEACHLSFFFFFLLGSPHHITSHHIGSVVREIAAAGEMQGKATTPVEQANPHPHYSILDE